MLISSPIVMTKHRHGRRRRCGMRRTCNHHYVSTLHAMRSPGGWCRHRNRWYGCGSSIPHCAFPISKTCWALIGMPKTSRDTKKDCGKPGCPNDHRSQVVARGDEVIEQSGDFRSWAVFRPCARSDLSPECTPKRTFAHASGFMGRIGVANSFFEIAAFHLGLACSPG